MRTLRAAIISIAFAALLASGASAAGIMLDRVVAVVNSEAITWGQLYKAMEFELSREGKSLSVEQKKAIFEESEAIFLENMINTKLQLQEAEKLGVRASDREIDAAIQGIKDKYSMTQEQFASAIKAEGFTVEEYRGKLREQIVIGKLLDLEVRSRIYISKEELGGAAGDAFYWLRQIFIKAGPGAEEKAGAAMAEIDSGADFAEVVRRYSDDRSSVDGDLGFVQKGKMSGEFANAVENLSPGQTSRPFATSGGIHIIRVEQVRGAREVLTEERFMEAYADWLRGLREKAFIEIRL